MSTTSTTYSRHRKRGSGRREDEVEGERSSDVSMRSRDFYTEGGREPQMENGKWSSNKLKHELSSFIAEFSYLTDTSNKTQNNPTPKVQSNANTPQQNVQVYAARKGKMSSPFQEPELRRRGVEWEDQQRGAVVYSVQNAAGCDRPSRCRVARRGVFRHAPKMRVKKSRSVRRSTSRDLSCPLRARSKRRVRRRFSGFRASKSRSQKGRTRSCRSETPMRRRVRSRVKRRCRTPSTSRSYVRDVPFRVRHRKTQEIIVKRSKPKVVFQKIEPCAEPTLVTLFPKTVKRRPRRLPSKEPVLPCKCDMCTNKYQSLARLYRNPCFNPCAPPCLPICAPYPPICAPCPPICAPRSPLRSPCPPKCQVVPRDCSPCSPNWYCNTGGMTYNRPWANQCYKEDCCQPFASRCVRSVCFKFGTTGQCLNSNITHYFHSILDRRGGACY